jgi:hypothetical protein
MIPIIECTYEKNNNAIRSVIFAREFHRARKTVHSPRLVFADRDRPESGCVAGMKTSVPVLVSMCSLG